jgi:hypothetical protein
LDLTVESKTLKWGNWVTEPKVIEKNDSGLAVSVESERGCWTGAEFSVIWKTKHGTVNLSVNIPFRGDNESSLISSGSLEIEGWSPLPAEGHVFSRAITISDRLD